LPLTLAFCAGAVLCAGEAPPPVTPPVTDLPLPKKKDEALPDIDWSAMKQTFDEEKGAVVLSGSAWVRFKGTKLEADHIVFFRQTREVYAEGSIRLRLGESEVSAQSAYMDFTSDVGWMLDATVRVSKAPEEDMAGGKKPDQKRDELRRLAPEKSVATFLRARDPYGVYLAPADDPQARTNLIFRASKVVRQGKLKLTAEDAFVTTDDMVHPMYGVKAGEVEFHLEEAPDLDRPGHTTMRGRKVVARRGRVTMMGFSTFPFPKISYDLVEGYPFFSYDSGNSSRWGPYVLTRWGYYLGSGQDRIFDPQHVYLDLDERWRRGPGIGAEFDWQLGRRPVRALGDKVQLERGEGHIRFYAEDEIQTSAEDDRWRANRDRERRIQPKFDGFPRQSFDANLLFSRRRRLDDAGPPSFEMDTYRDEWRGMVDFQQHQPLKRFAGLDNVQLDFKYQRESDRDFMLEYFQQNYMKNNQPEALASIRKPGDNYSVELLYRTNPQEFDGAPPRSAVDYGTFTGYEPALTYSLAPMPLAYGVYVAGEAQGARMKRYFERDIYDQDDFTAGRGYAKVDFSRPFRWRGVTVVPHLGTQQQIYDDSRDDGAIGQGAVTYGLDVSSRIYGLFPDLVNEELGLKGMRHIIEPRLSYRGVSDTHEDPVNILDFDEVDDLTAVDKITLALDQTFQTRHKTKDGGTRVYNLAGWDMSLEYYPRARDQERLLGGDALGLFRMDGYLRVVEAVRFDGHIGVSLEDGKIEKAAYGIEIDPHTRWRLRLEERYNFDDDNRAIAGSDQYRVKFDFQMSERWGFTYEHISEKRRSLLQRKGRQVERLSVTRSYGALDVSFTYALDRNWGDHAFFVSLRPAATYRNLILPTQDLLVAEGEVSGAPDEAPEERNFDPFDLLRKRKKAPADTQRTPDRDAPVPPLPTPDRRVDRGAADTAWFRDPNEPSSAGLFLDPKDARPARRPARMDDDDWTTPPPTPTSTR
jgi:lipopolysaccharide export system protein LptA